MDKNRTSQTSTLWLYFGGLALLTAVALLLTWTAPQPFASDIAQWAQTFLALFSNSLPFLIFGSLAAGLIDHFLPASTIKRYTPTQLRSGLLTAALLGLALPFGEVGIIPIAWVLHKKGFPTPLTLTFILAAPVVNIITFLATATTLGWGWGFLQIAAALLIAITTGAIFSRLSQARLSQMQLRPLDEDIATNNFWTAVVSGADLLLRLLPYFVTGCIIAAVWEASNSAPVLIRSAQNGLTSVLVGLAIALMQGQTPLTDGSVTADLLTTTAGTTAIYLILGTMLGLPTITTLTAVLKIRTLALLILLVSLLTLGLGLLINTFT